jgi:hypothetical protein
MEEVRKGVPARLYYRIDMDSLAQLITSTTHTVPKGEPDSTNVQTVSAKGTDYIEGVEREEERVPERSSKNARNYTPSQTLTDSFYAALKEKYDIRLTGKRYEFHLGKFRDILNTDQATPEEQERVLSHMTKNYPNAPKINAVDALADVRLGRDTGEAWNKPAPWEVAKDEKANTQERREYDKYDRPLPDDTAELMRGIGLG